MDAAPATGTGQRNGRGRLQEEHVRDIEVCSRRLPSSSHSHCPFARPPRPRRRPLPHSLYLTEDISWTTTANRLSPPSTAAVGAGTPSMPTFPPEQRLPPAHGSSLRPPSTATGTPAQMYTTLRPEPGTTRTRSSTLGALSRSKEEPGTRRRRGTSMQTSTTLAQSTLRLSGWATMGALVCLGRGLEV